VDLGKFGEITFSTEDGKSKVFDVVNHRYFSEKHESLVGICEERILCYALAVGVAAKR